MGTERRWNDNDRRNPKYSGGKKTVPVPLCPPQTPQRTGQRLNAGLRGKKPSTNCRSHGTLPQCIRVGSSQIQTTVSPSTVVTQLPAEVAIRFAMVSTKYYHNPLNICDLPTVHTTYGCCNPGCVVCRLFSTT